MCHLHILKLSFDIYIIDLHTSDTIPCCRVWASAGAASYLLQASPRVRGQQGRERRHRGQAAAHRHQAPGRGLQQPEIWQRWALNTYNKNVSRFARFFRRLYYFLHPIQSSHDVGNCRIWKKRVSRVSWKLILGCLDVETTGENNNNKAWDHETRDNGAVTGTRGIRHSVKLDVSRFYEHINFGILCKCFNSMF